LGALQHLDVRLFVHRQHHCVVRRIEAQADDVGGLGRKLRGGADAPTAPPLQVNGGSVQRAPTSDPKLDSFSAAFRE